MRPLSAANIERAMEVIDPIFLRTPVLRDAALDDAVGCEVACKVEILNPIRSFKGRGTSFYASTLDSEHMLVCASAGNFGQGLARAAASRGIPCVVFAATNANRLKLDAMRALGADVRLAGDDFDAAKQVAAEFARESDARYVEDGAIPEIAEGAGTIALELLEHDAEPEVLLVPLGNGALLGGIATWCRHAGARTRVIGVVAAGAPCMKYSFDADAPVRGAHADTIADGIAVREPVPYAVETLRGVVDEVITVTDAQIIAAMRLAHDHLDLVVEPAGAAGLAALVSSTRFAGARVATPLCGGNVTPDDARRWLGA